MNFRYLVGSAASRLTHAVLSSRSFPLTRYVPPGHSWLYDVQRTMGTRDAGVIFDVGANVGQTAYGLVRYFPHAQIHCFEPVQDTFAKLKANYGNFRNIHFVPMALGARNETLAIPLHENSELNTLAPGGATQGGGTGRTETIEVTTLDAYCQAHGIQAIDVLKLDVQGWELNVLRGQKTPARFVLAEVGFVPWEKDMQYFAELNDYMTAQGYRLSGMYDFFRYGATKEIVGFANALYLRTP